MTPNSPHKPVADLDALLSDFFKSQLKKPWPKAPVPAATTRVEPSELVAARAEPPRNAPNTPAFPRDNSARARFTLAASVALLLGTGWFLGDGFQPGPRAEQNAAPGPHGHKFLPDSGADGDKHPSLKKMGEDKAKGNDTGIKIDVVE